MSASNLEIGGSLAKQPLVELLKEAAEAELSGSFRLAHERAKTVVYLEQGTVVYAVSNLRAHRLTDCLARWGVFRREDLTEFAAVTPDFALAARLVAEKRLAANGSRVFQGRQVAEIIQTALGWNDGEWTFSPLARLREPLEIELGLPNLLFDTARRMLPEAVGARFAGQNGGTFVRSNAPTVFDLQPEEAFVLSRVEGASLIEEVAAACGLPEAVISPILYRLWISGLLRRHNYQRAFSEEKIAQILRAKLAVRQAVNESPAKPVLEAATVQSVNAAVSDVPASTETESSGLSASLGADNPQQDLEKFLTTVEAAKNYYALFGVTEKTDAREIKAVYLRMVKNFHPDKFHDLVGTPVHSRLHTAFTAVGQAYETLRDAKTREVYDFKLSKSKSGEVGDEDLSKLSAEQLAERGRAALERKDYQRATALLARAVTLEPKTAQYRFLHGLTLAANPKFYRQAESELQTAVQFEPRKAEFRLELARFYLVLKMPRRAVGELERLLAFAPAHEEARRLLDSLR